MRLTTSMIGIILAMAVLGGCAGTEGAPDDVKQILESKYVGRHVEEVFLDLGPADEREILTSGNRIYSWTRSTGKYDRNLFIKSDERCSFIMMADTSDIVTKIGTVDDSLGAWEISYCKEQFSL